MIEASIVENIKDIRQKQKITLEQLAARTGLTKGYLSRIERSKKAPPFSTLNRIAVALGVDVTFFLKEDSEDLQDIRISFTKSNKRKIVDTVGSFYGYIYEALAHDKPGKNMVPYIIHPVFEKETIFQHEGEEFLYVLEGTCEFTFDDKKYLLEKGDSVYC